MYNADSTYHLMIMFILLLANYCELLFLHNGDVMFLFLGIGGGLYSLHSIPTPQCHHWPQGETCESGDGGVWGCEDHFPIFGLEGG